MSIWLAEGRPLNPEAFLASFEDALRRAGVAADRESHNTVIPQVTWRDIFEYGQMRGAYPETFGEVRYDFRDPL
jgi:hypothetical protein